MNKYNLDWRVFFLNLIKLLNKYKTLFSDLKFVNKVRMLALSHLFELGQAHHPFII